MLAVRGIGSTAGAQAPRTPATGASGDLREMVFGLSAHDIGITRDNYPRKVWGVIMETGLDSGYYTLVVLADGSTSLYFSSGGGIIGAGEYPAVHAASAEFLAAANRGVAQARPATSHPPPAEGETVFYFLTFSGMQTWHAREQDLGGGRDPLSDLFRAAQATITAIRTLPR